MIKAHMKRYIAIIGLLMLSLGAGAQEATNASGAAEETPAVMTPTNAPAPAAPEAVTPPVAPPEPAPAVIVPAAEQPAATAAATPTAPVIPPVAAPEPAPAVVVPPAAPAPAASVAEVPAAPVVQPEPKDVEPTPVGARELAQQEELRRKALEIQAGKSEAEGDEAMHARDYTGAVKAYDEALKAQPDGRPNTAELRARFRQKKLDAYVSAAENALKKHNANEVRRLVAEAQKVAPDDKRPARILAKIERIVPELPTTPAIVPVRKREEVVKKKRSQKDVLDEGRQYFEIKDYDRAEAMFDKMLIEDPYDVDAMRFLRRIGEVRYNITSTEREATVADMMNQVRDSWNPHTRKESTLPLMVQKPGLVEPTDVARTREKLKSLIIPSLNFQGANIADVLATLSTESAAQDTEDHTGVNIVLKLGPSAQEGEAAPVAPGGAPPPAVNAITLNLRKVSLLDAIKYITELAGLSYRIDRNVVVILPRGYMGNLMTRMYPISPSAISSMAEKAAAAPAAGGAAGGVTVLGAAQPAAENRTDVRQFFIQAGVPFPEGTSVTYNQAISKLIVANTPENIEKVENLLSELDFAAKQVEIEARFVEVQQNFLEELGLQMALTDNFEIANKVGPGSPTSKERIQINKDSNGITKGLRFFNGVSGSPTLQSAAMGAVGATSLGSVLTFASVLTNPELQVVVNALSQKGNSDVLSAPRVTTKAGEQATIKVVKEIRYPQSYEPAQIQIADQGVGGGGGGGVNIGVNRTVTVFAPADFQTRETGVILNVTPTVGPDGYTIDLTLVPEVSEIVEWHQFGTQTGSNQNFNAEQPFFSTRTITSKLVVWDGETVVMGGLIREDLVKHTDKIPFLGDIPLIGRLFRSEGEYSQKKNLMIFVTARIVDSSGRPIHKKERGTTMRTTVVEPPAARTAIP
ncbi:MAG: hypothetical protein NTV49_12415 [Kiritimatiellaeota bacterium]|nr:hypothetical protein [Kiritimatiellota bacterium]